MYNLKEVTKDEFYNFIMPKDVVYSAEGNFPFVGIWKTRSGDLVGKSIPHGRQLGISTDENKYYLRQL
jgi:hypothetical protein